MRKFLFIFCILSWVMIYQSASAQNKIVGYDYWFDNDSINNESLTKDTQLTLKKSFDLTGLGVGLHTFNLRFLDDSGGLSVPLSQFFFIQPESNNDAAKLRGYEYWFDHQNTMQEVSFSSTGSYTLIDSLIVDTLDVGLHTFNVRFMDDSSRYSAPLSQFFFRKPKRSKDSARLTRFQYWYDNADSMIQEESLASLNQFHLMRQWDMSSLTSGLHVINMRFGDQLGNWSVPLSQFFFVKPQETNVGETKLATYEYWFDDDYLNHTQGDLGSIHHILIEQVDVSALDAGLHTFHIRFKDSLGNYNSALSQFFYKKRERDTSSKELVQLRYWYNSDFDNVFNLSINPQTQQYSLLDTLYVLHLNEGAHTLHYQFRDNKGNWSVATTDTIQKPSIPLAIFEMDSIKYCDSLMFSFSNSSIDADSIHWSFGDGGESSDWSPTYAYAQEGVYNLRLYIKDTSSGFDTSRTDRIHVSFLPKSGDSLTWVVCDSVQSPSGQYTWIQSGLYYDTIPNYLGCDSNLKINLIVNSSRSESIAPVSCFYYVSPSMRDTWYSSGAYTDTITTYQGCDSIVQIQLTVNTVDTVVTQTGPVLLAQAQNASYQWLECDNNFAPLPGDTFQSFTATKNGNYAVEVTQNNCTLRSSCYSVVNAGINQAKLENSILVYPNPTEGWIHVEVLQSIPDLKVHVFDMQGRLMQKENLANKTLETIQLNYPAGLYYLCFYSEDFQMVRRVIKE